ncbi:putative serine esterase [Diplodia seriata]|uniref:Putative serine esterase n=1 Tax=Diplodia seriata TaxID=420778 RepID=A0A1S8BME4_9PEZI|nr:putative serine esterase [Diplodia seriata]
MYDVVDWVYKQPWCNGSVAFAGNSWLAIAQINFAARLSHPAVKAFAPWEGMTDVYRQQAVRGGIPRVEFAENVILKGFAGIFTPFYHLRYCVLTFKRPWSC